MVESTLAYNLKTNFFADLQFSQSHIANYVASFKAQKVMLPSLKCQIICFWSSFVLFTELSRQQIQLSKIWICHLIVYMAKYPHAKKIKKIHWVVKNVSHTDGQAERMNWTDFTGPLPQKWRFDHVFQKCKNKIFYFGFIMSHIIRIITRKKNTINLVRCSKSSKTIISSKFM